MEGRVILGSNQRRREGAAGPPDELVPTSALRSPKSRDRSRRTSRAFAEWHARSRGECKTVPVCQFNNAVHPCPPVLITLPVSIGSAADIIGSWTPKLDLQAA